jgi:hypothetical protein
MGQDRIWNQGGEVCSSVTRVVNLFKEPYDIYIGRPSEWGNPFSHKASALANQVFSRDIAIQSFRDYAVQRLKREPLWLEPLRGKTLGCFCKPQDCHGDVIVELIGD